MWVVNIGPGRFTAWKLTRFNHWIGGFVGLTADLVILLHFVFFPDGITAIIIALEQMKGSSLSSVPVKLHGYYSQVKLHLCITVTYPMCYVYLFRSKLNLLANYFFFFFWPFVLWCNHWLSWQTQYLVSSNNLSFFFLVHELDIVLYKLLFRPFNQSCVGFRSSEQHIICCTLLLCMLLLHCWSPLLLPANLIPLRTNSHSCSFFSSSSCQQLSVSVVQFVCLVSFPCMSIYNFISLAYTSQISKHDFRLFKALPTQAEAHTHNTRAEWQSKFISECYFLYVAKSFRSFGRRNDNAFGCSPATAVFLCHYHSTNAPYTLTQRNHRS
jgi:hypothetical protein